MRRKGERPVARYLDQWTPQHPVAHAMATGSSWFDAWLGQKATPIYKLARMTAIHPARLMAIASGDRISRAELDALAIAWSISAADLAASLDDPGRLVE